MEEPVYFKTSNELREWFEENHLATKEVWVGFYKVATGIESITWPESVDQALCFGWIDGIRKKVDSQSYKIRFTPRNPKSHWSAVNLKKMKQLKTAELLTKAGLKVFEARNKANAQKASYEQKPIDLSAEYYELLKSDEAAYTFFKKLAPSYKKISAHWVMRAVKEETRNRRFQILFQSCAEGKKIPQLRKKGE